MGFKANLTGGVNTINTSIVEITLANNSNLKTKITRITW